MVIVNILMSILFIADNNFSQLKHCSVSSLNYYLFHSACKDDRETPTVINSCQVTTGHHKP